MIIKPLTVWVQNILPVVYDDSLSYLEIVAKINAKTNEIISQTNENTHAIETLASIIAELGDIDELKALLDEIQVIVEDLYSTDAPLMDGTASAGSADHAARSDHVHPSDTSKLNKADVANSEDGVSATNAYSAGNYLLRNGTLYKVISSIAVGDSFSIGTNIEEAEIGNELVNLNTLINGKAPLASPALTGTPTAPTATDGTNTTQLATTAFVKSSVDKVGKNPLVGKKVGFWGDSIMYGDTGSGRVAKPYPTIFGELTGAIIENNAIGGTTMTNVDSNSFINRVSGIDWTQYDYAVLGYGTNDVGRGVYLLTQDNTGFYYAYRSAIRTMLTANPKLRIVLCGATYKTGLNTTFPPSNISQLDIHYAIRTIAFEFGLPFIDFLYGAGINSSNSSLLADGLHFTQDGYTVLGEYLANNFVQSVSPPNLTFDQTFNNNYATRLNVQAWSGTTGGQLVIMTPECRWAFVFMSGSLSVRFSTDGGATWTYNDYTPDSVH